MNQFNQHIAEHHCADYEVCPQCQPTDWSEFWRDLLAVLNAVTVYIHPPLQDKINRLVAAPIFDNERAAQVLAHYETQIEELLRDDLDMSPFHDDVHALMLECLQTLRGERVDDISSVPATEILYPTRTQKITKKRQSKTARTKIPQRQTNASQPA
jgi:hypothetical protein